MKRPKEKGDSKVIKGLTTMRNQRGAPLWIKRNDIPRDNAKTILRDHVTARLKGESTAILVVNCWNKLPEEVVVVGAGCEFKGRLDSAWLAVFGEEIV